MKHLIVAARVGIYLAAAWLIVGGLANGLFPHALALVIALAIYTTAPLAVFARWRGWPFYPKAAFRLLVVRPFWYTQLMLPFVGGGATLGVLIGSIFGAPLLGGRIAAGVVLGAWPVEPELVHWENLSELVPHLVGALPEGAGAMEMAG